VGAGGGKGTHRAGTLAARPVDGRAVLERQYLAEPGGVIIEITRSDVLGSASANGEGVMDIEAVGGAVRGDGHAVSG
jgi:hypothetical protein